MELHQLISFDQHLFLALNGVHGAYADRFMWLYTQTWTWIPSLLVMLAVIIRTKKKESIWILLAMVLAIVFADQVSSGLIKPIAERFRPSHEPALDGLVHLVNGYHGGYYGFVSSHVTLILLPSLCLRLCCSETDVIPSSYSCGLWSTVIPVFILVCIIPETY